MPDGAPTRRAWFTARAKAPNRAEVVIYDEVGTWGVSSKDFIDTLKSIGEPAVIDVRLNSGGGDVFDGLAIHNALRRHPARIDVWVDGLAASIASIIAMAGDTISIPENAYLMIHDPSAFVIGGAEEMDKMADTLRSIKQSLVNIYARRTGIGPDEIAALMSEESWMDGKTAVARGFATTLIDAEPIAAQLDLTKFSKVPADARRLFGGIAMETTTTDRPVAASPVANVEVAAINAAWRAARRLDLLDECERLLGEGIDAGEIPSLLIEAHARRAHSVSATQRVFPSGGVSVGRSHDDPAAIRGRMVAALVARATGSAPPDAAREYRGAPLAEMIRILAAARGERTGSWTVADAIDYGIRCASPLTTSDLPGLLQGTGQRILDAAFAAASSAFVQVARTLEVPDFRSFDVLRRGEWPSLQPVLESGEVTYGPVAEEKETLKVATYARNLGLSRTALINDDLRVFTNPARDAGQAAAEAVASKIVSELALNSGSGPNLSDGNPVFTTARGNKASSGAAISNTSLGAARRGRRSARSNRSTA